MEEDNRKSMLVQKQRNDEISMRRSQDRKQKEHLIRMEQDRLKKQERIEAVERLRKIEEYNKSKQVSIA